MQQEVIMQVIYDVNKLIEDAMTQVSTRVLLNFFGTKVGTPNEAL